MAKVAEEVTFRTTVKDTLVVEVAKEVVEMEAKETNVGIIIASSIHRM